MQVKAIEQVAAEQWASEYDSQWVKCDRLLKLVTIKCKLYLQPQFKHLNGITADSEICASRLNGF